MKITLLLISTILSWTAFDHNLFRKRRSLSSHSLQQIWNDPELEQLQQKKRVLVRRLDVIPKSFRDYRKPSRSKCNYFSTKPRDVRYSDQMKIRRRINNILRTN